MQYKEYSTSFIKEAQNRGYSEDYINRCLSYAKPLVDKSLPIIFDQANLALLLGIKPIFLYAVSNDSQHFYRKFKIKKKNGKERIIHEPLPLLKEIQKWILNEILYKIECSPYSKAFKKNMSIKDNAKFHKKQKVLINMDIKDYFGTIKTFHIYSFFEMLGYKKDVATMLTKICTLKGSLPQGAPTSPCLSNLVTVTLDEKLFNFAISHNPKMRYSRYADDISMSGECNPSEVIREVRTILKKEGFEANQDKTRVSCNNKRQEVTGIVVNSNLQVSKDKRKKVRQSMYFIKKFGLDEHLRMIGWKNSKQKYIDHLLGVVNFILFINPNDNENKKYRKELLKIIQLKALINSKENDIFNKGMIFDDI